MYECPNCGGNLRFDIASQQLACGYCNEQYDPYAITKDKDAEEGTDYEVTVFTCPQCAGEIYSTDNTAAGFCSFCGASTILDSRLREEKRPDFIIPFKKTKEDCKTAYIKRVKKAVFAPKELKNEKYIDSFRGIYMPYWVYDFTQQGPLCLGGTTEHRSGDYIITRLYTLRGDLDNCYQGLSYDASSSFADNISERIAPFDVKKMQPFTPSILSGFYADIPDVGQEIYAPEAETMVNEQTKRYLEVSKEMSKYKIKISANPSEEYHTKCENTEISMFPVWFMSYRNKGRVAYATVNGESGKVVADLPVDIKKYLLGSVLLAVPLVFLLNLFLTVVPFVLLGITAAISLLVTVLYGMEIRSIAKKESYEEDKGIQEALRKKRQAESEAAAALDGMAPYVMTEEQVGAEGKKKKGVVTAGCFSLGVSAFAMLLVPALIIFPVLIEEMGVPGTCSICIYILLAFTLGFGMKSIADAKKVRAKKGIPGSVWTMAAVLLAAILAFIRPASDIYYYAGNLICLAAVFFALLDLISDYNLLATRPLPQFEYRGGDDRA
ncbi:MAG: hypothetical protein NC300_08305 [Bacteroidales bacterium]|nr:hypothetical protein [Clostridium sp.]MCM1204133.1 hypothetical protein [Bacteroidales bacterium]